MLKQRDLFMILSIIYRSILYFWLSEMHEGLTVGMQSVTSVGCIHAQQAALTDKRIHPGYIAIRHRGIQETEHSLIVCRSLGITGFVQRLSILKCNLDCELHYHKLVGSCWYVCYSN